MDQHVGSTIALRTTQRAPRSCLSCSSRKVKCDKSVPCSRCIKRGQAEACVREMVVIRGQVTTWQDNSQTLTYEELRRENQRLRREINALRTQREQLSLSPSVQAAAVCPEQQPRNATDCSQDGLDDELWESLASESAIRSSTVSSWEDIILPTVECSRRLIDFDMMWNSWVHYALEYPRFKEESDAFMDSIETGLSIEQAETTWVAVYFSVLSTALLMMEDDEVESLSLYEEYTAQQVSQNWYDAAIFCLYKSDFMRCSHVNSVQAIAILIMSFYNRGDSELGHHLRSSAIRIAQRIGLDKPYSEKVDQCLSAEGQHRLWWTLVICEWLSLTRQSPMIDDTDFNVPLPSITQPEVPGGLVDPVHYHVFMARTSAVIYRFRVALKSRSKSLHSIVKIVRAADEELAGIIDTLPSHLQPESDSTTNEEIHALELTQPWIKWQRYDLTLVLLHLRMHINRTLQMQWLSSPDEFHWAQSVSVASAMSIIWINRNWDQPVSARKQWALSYHIFNSAILLLHECQAGVGNQNATYNESIQAAIGLLDAVESHNVLAHHAAKVLRERLNDIE